MDTETAERDEGGIPGAWELVDKLPPMERVFVIRVLKGESLEESAKAAGWRSELGMVMALGRPRVREALEQLVPLAMEPKEAAKVLSRYWTAKLVSVAAKGSDAQATGAAKELANLAGLGVSKESVTRATIGDVIKALESRNPTTPRRLPPAEVVK